MPNSLFQALSGGQSPSVPQPNPQPVAPPTGGSAAGSPLAASPEVINAIRQAAGNGQPLHKALGGIPASSDKGFSPEEAARRQAIRASFGYK